MKLRQSLLRAALVALLASMMTSTSFATLYKWTDENGRTVYGDQPPPTAKSERLNPGVAPADPNAVRDLANKDAEMKKRAQQRADDAAKADKDQAEAKRKLDICTQSRGRIRTMRDATPVYKYDEKGDKVYYEAVDREKAIAESEKNLRDLNCPPAPSS
jgi:Domain of unknown function (DUF4124)